LQALLEEGMMRADQTFYTRNVIPFQVRSERRGDPVDDAAQRDNIIRMLDLSKFERSRPAVETNPNMLANIVAMALLGLLVFLAKEDFCKLEQANLCSIRSECIH
jgi:hypothetical protein